MSNYKLWLPIALSSIALAGCNSSSSSNDNGGGEDPSEAEEVLIDSSSGAQTKVDLDSGTSVTDENWHVSYQKYVGFALNGGISGEGKVAGCIAAEFDSLFDEDGNAVADEFKLLTGTNTLESFEGVTIDSCTSFEEDTLETRIDFSDWVSYDYINHIVSAKEGNAFLIRHSDGSTMSRFSVTSLDNQKETTISVQLWNDGWQEARDISFNFADERTYIDFDTNSAVTESEDWDMSFTVDGYDYPLQVNGGASGEGNGSVADVESDVVAADTFDPTDETVVSAYHWGSDATTGIMDGPGSFGALHYGVDGGHDMWPTFTTYLLQQEIADGVYQYYKVQIISNTGPDGGLVSGNLVYRYEILN
ncbi:HmuY family protein [Vibrio sp. FNV 38]|nr:HmuY family protein [Vibrio sp. FNV 38]